MPTAGVLALSSLAGYGFARCEFPGRRWLFAFVLFGLAVPAGTPIHHMHLRVTVDDSFCIRAIETAMDSTPYGECKTADATLQRMVGQTMGPGWRQAIERAIGGVQGCTHLRELLFNLATAAFQTIPHAIEMRRREAAKGHKLPVVQEGGIDNPLGARAM